MKSRIITIIMSFMLIFSMTTGFASTKSTSSYIKKEVTQIVEEFFQRYYKACYLPDESQGFSDILVNSNETADVMCGIKLAFALNEQEMAGLVEIDSSLNDIETTFKDVTVEIIETKTFKIEKSAIYIIVKVSYEAERIERGITFPDKLPRQSGQPWFGIVIKKYNTRFKIAKIIKQQDGEGGMVTLKKLKAKEIRTTKQIMKEYEKKIAVLKKRK